MHRVVLCIAASLAFTLPVVGQSIDGEAATRPVGIPAEGEFAYDRKEAEAWRDEIVPAVEAVSGRSFKSIPDLRIVSRDELHKAVVANGVRRAKSVNPSFDERDEMLLTIDTLLPSVQLLALYDQHEKVILLPAGNFRPLMNMIGVRDQPTGPLISVFLAHELSHALHDQYLPLAESLANVRTVDGARTHRAVTEGFAMLIQELVAERTGLTDAEAIARHVVRSEGEGPEFERHRRANEESYGAGYRFFRAHYDVGGIERVWEILENPPIVYGQIVRPMTYGEPVEMEVRIDSLFQGLETMIGPGPWQSNTMKVETGIGRTFVVVSPEAADEVDTNAERAFTIMFNDRATGRMRGVTVLKFTNDEFGPTYLDHLEGLRDAQVASLRSRGGFTAEGSERAELPGCEAEHVRVLRTTLSMTGQEETRDFVVVGATRANVGVQFVGFGGTIEDATTGEVMTLLLDRMASGAVHVPVPLPDTDSPLVRALARIDAYLDGGDWESESREVNRSALTNIAGNDVETQFAVETLFDRGQHTSRNRDKRKDGGEAEYIMVTLFAFTSEEGPEVLTESLMKQTQRSFEMMTSAGARVSDIEIGELRTLDDGTVVARTSARIQDQFGDSAVLRVYVARRDALLALIHVMGTPLTEPQVESYLAEMFTAARR